MWHLPALLHNAFAGDALGALAHADAAKGDAHAGRGARHLSALIPLGVDAALVPAAEHRPVCAALVHRLLEMAS